MPYLVDGHNLIGAMPGLRLDDPNDEAKLIELLRRFCARTGRQVVVHFDRRAPGVENPATRGGLTVRFVAGSADAAIRQRLERLRGEAHNWTVVSSDREVQQAAERARAQVLNSQTFARQLAELGQPHGAGEKPEAPPSLAEIEELERQFRRRREPPSGDAP